MVPPVAHKTKIGEGLLMSPPGRLPKPCPRSRFPDFTVELQKTHTISPGMRDAGQLPHLLPHSRYMPARCVRRSGTSFGRWRASLW